MFPIQTKKQVIFDPTQKPSQSRSLHWNHANFDLPHWLQANFDQRRNQVYFDPNTEIKLLSVYSPKNQANFDGRIKTKRDSAPNIHAHTYTAI